MSIGSARPASYIATLALVLSAVGTARAAAQESRPQIHEVQSQIETDVWRPLLAASNTFDADGFLAIQSSDLVRIALDARQVYGLAQYEKEIRDGFARARSRGITRSSDARFLNRIVSADHAYETGYFRSEVRMPSGEVTVRYSRFYMVLRKESGSWRILVDQDTREGGNITEEAFRAATPLRESGATR